MLYVILILLQLIKAQIQKSNEEILKATAVSQAKGKYRRSDATFNTDISKRLIDNKELRKVKRNKRIFTSTILVQKCNPYCYFFPKNP